MSPSGRAHQGRMKGVVKPVVVLSLPAALAIASARPDGGSVARAQLRSRIDASRTWLRIGLRETSMFLDPNRDNLAVVQFEQQYSSDNLNQQMRRRQYWQFEGGAWRIVYEGNA